MKWRTPEGAAEVFVAWWLIIAIVYILAQCVRWAI